ncbi:MAG: FKBP-type peptidyl-prolyl cis-trans isomerase [Candidatus Kapabacteria bacterium]|jgi:FKBP-type peptidyl-prolyl cis-trans isomerase|nr:FKBP-type peptidyl-prolyl cis-trans isomerase [Candidatus Kapabacteria bacterium]
MKGIVAALSALLIFSCTAESQVNSVKPTTKKDTASYALGVNVGTSLREQKIPITTEMLLAGLRDAMENKALLTDEQVKAALMALQQEMVAAADAEKAKSATSNKEAGEKFLAENKKKPGVITTASGLQYKVITQGKGAKPAATSTVKVHYKGTLIDGKVFDSSYDRGEPIEFPLNGVIAGWTEGVQLMSVGSKFEFYIPGNLAYGERGAGQDIGPNSTLIFVVELLDITKP